MIDSSAARRGVAALALIYLLLTPAIARADGDPASDTLYTGNVFFPYSTKVTPALAHELEQATTEAETAGRPVRVALIAAPVDLGAIPSLFGQPKTYARFLGMELQFVYPGRLLVVMPQGAALALKGHLLADTAVDRAKVGPGGDGLARSALALVRGLRGGSTKTPSARPPLRRVAVPGAAPRAAVPGAAPRVAGSMQKPRGIPTWEGAAVGVAVVGGILLGGLAFVRRRVRANRLQDVGPIAVRPPDPDDPYRYTGPL